MAGQILVRYEELVAGVDRLLAEAGVPAVLRGIEAEITAEADLLGVPSHGVALVPPLIASIRTGEIKAAPQTHILRQRGATCVFDGDSGPGRYTAWAAMDHAIARAREHGVGVSLATNMTHWGRGHAYAYRAAQTGMIAVCATNAMSNMLAFGSSGPLLGNNPLAVGVPRRPGEDPIVLDMAMSQTAIGRIGIYAREGREVPLGWGLDDAGNPTNDAAAIMASRKVLPMGEHKGAGLALVIELMTAALAAGSLCYEIAFGAGGLDTGTSKIFIALDIEAFNEREAFLGRVDDLLKYLKHAGGPDREILYPGERGWRTRERYLAEGVPIFEHVTKQLAELGLTFNPVGP